MGDEHTAKSAGHQARCDELAGAVAAVFKTDAPAKFSYSKFTLSTHLPGDETEDEADEYAAQVLGEAAGDDEDEEFGPEDVSYPSGTYPDGTSPDEHNPERPGPLAQGPPGRSAVPGYAGTRPGTVPWYT